MLARLAACLAEMGQLEEALRCYARVICEQLLHRNVQRFRGGLVFKAHRLLYLSTLCLRVIKKKKKTPGCQGFTLPSATLGRSQDVCKGARFSVEGERCVVSS